jgi:hypothetical protein
MRGVGPAAEASVTIRWNVWQRLEPVRVKLRVGLAVARTLPLGVDEQSEDVTDRSLSTDGFWQGEMVLDAIAVAAPVPVLDDVAGFGQVRDDGEGAALGDVERGGDVAQAHPGVVRDADEDPGMVGEEAPLGRGTSVDRIFVN